MSEVSARALARSTLYVNAAQVWQVASRVVLTPFVITAIGIDGYGTWALLLSVCSFVIALNASFGVAYSKLTAELDRKHEYARLGEVIGSGIALAGGVALLGLGASWMLHASIFPALGVPPRLFADAERGLLVLIVAILLQVSLGCALHVLGGFQRIDLQYGITIVGSVVDFSTALPLLYAGFGLVALPLGFLAGELVSGGIAWLLCRGLRPEVVLSPFRATASGLRQVMSLGFRFHGVLLLNEVVRQAIRMLISSLCGTGTLGAFHLADRLIMVARAPGRAIITPLLPAFANLAAGEEPNRWRGLFTQASRALTMAGIVPLLFAAMFADTVLFAWTGHRYPDAAWTVRVLVPAEFATLMMSVAASRLRATGTVRLELVFGLTWSVLALGGLAIGYPVAGYAGIVLALAAARAAAALWFLQRFARLTQLHFREYVWPNLIRPAAVLTPVVVAAGLLGDALPVLRSSEATRLAVLFTLLLLAGGCVLVCAAVAWIWVLSVEERAMVRRLANWRARETAA